MRTSQKVAAAIAGVGLAGVAAVSVPAFAADSAPSPSPSASSSPGAPAPDTSKDPGGLKSTLDTLVSKGTITQAQADTILSQMQSDRAARAQGDPGWGGHHGRGMEGRHGMGGMGGMGMRGAGLLSTAAKTLGLSEDDLRTKLRSQSLGEIADAQKVSRATLKEALAKQLAADTDELLDALIERAPGQHMRQGAGPSSSPSSPATAPSSFNRET